MVSRSKQGTGVILSKKQRISNLAAEMRELAEDTYDSEANTSASIDILRKLIKELAVDTDYLNLSKTILAYEKKVEVY